MSATRRGAFIVFEGCDRSGKSTQSRLLIDFLKKHGLSVKHLAFPARESSIGQVINSYLTNKNELNDEVIHLLFAANRWEQKKAIQKYLSEGTTLVVDRYSYSGVAYSVAKGLPYDWCYAPEKGLIRPDAVFYLCAASNQLTQRGNYGEERYEKHEFQTKVADVFNRICFQEGNNYWYPLDACDSAEKLHELVCTQTLKVVDEVAQQPLKVLT